MFGGAIAGFFVWLFLCAGVAVWAEHKGHKGFGYFFLAFFLSPVLGFIVVALISNKNVKECPFCKKSIDKTAKVCPYCRKDLVIHKNETTNNSTENNNSSDKETWIAKRIVDLIAEGKTATDAKIQAEAEYIARQ